MGVQDHLGRSVPFYPTTEQPRNRPALESHSTDHRLPSIKGIQRSFSLPPSFGLRQRDRAVLGGSPTQITLLPRDGPPDPKFGSIEHKERKNKWHEI